jgi:hypothetical protein
MYPKMGRFMISTVHPELCCGEIKKEVMRHMALKGRSGMHKYFERETLKNDSY